MGSALLKRSPKGEAESEPSADSPGESLRALRNALGSRNCLDHWMTPHLRNHLATVTKYRFPPPYHSPHLPTSSVASSARFKCAVLGACLRRTAKQNVAHLFQLLSGTAPGSILCFGGFR
jgi:hypothetical protein